MQNRIAPRGFHSEVAKRLKVCFGGTIAVSPDFNRIRIYAGKYRAEIVIAIPDELIPTSNTPEEINDAAAWIMARVAPALNALSQ